jgi:hypothetical protein
MLPHAPLLGCNFDKFGREERAFQIQLLLQSSVYPDQPDQQTNPEYELKQIRPKFKITKS